MIIHWPRGIRLPPGTILHQMTRVWDLYPTFLELAGDKTARPELMGSSLTPLFHDSSHRTEEFFISTFHRSKGLIDGKWKIVTYHDSPWELYNLRKDPSETRDLAKRKTRLLNKMIRRWQDYAQTHGFADDPQWNRPPGNEKRGWGVDFKRKGLVAAYPEFMSRIAPGSDRKLSLEFAGPVDFSNTENKMIRLQRYGDERIIWSADPDEGHPSQGKSRITFEDFPVLEPDTHYYITWDAAWVKYWDGSKNVPIPPIRESAFAYRFKTNKASIPD
jgi:arylsulfatase